jgi:hypothetical protein
MAPLNISYEPAFDPLARLLFDEADPDLVLMEYTYAIALEPDHFPQVPGLRNGGLVSSCGMEERWY